MVVLPETEFYGPSSDFTIKEVEQLAEKKTVDKKYPRVGKGMKWF